MSPKRLTEEVAAEQPYVELPGRLRRVPGGNAAISNTMYPLVRRVGCEHLLAALFRAPSIFGTRKIPRHYPARGKT